MREHSRRRCRLDGWQNDNLVQDPVAIPYASKLALEASLAYYITYYIRSGLLLCCLGPGSETRTCKIALAEMPEVFLPLSLLRGCYRGDAKSSTQNPLVAAKFLAKSCRETWRDRGLLFAQIKFHALRVLWPR